MKVMSVNDLLALMEGKVEVTEGGALSETSSAGLVEVYNANLPEGITAEIVGTVHKYDTHFFEAYGHAGATAMAGAAKTNADLAAGELKLDIHGHALSVAFSRPVSAEASEKEWRSSIGFGYGVAKPASLDKKARKLFAELMIDGDDE